MLRHCDGGMLYPWFSLITYSTLLSYPSLNRLAKRETLSPWILMWLECPSSSRACLKVSLVLRDCCWVYIFKMLAVTNMLCFLPWPPWLLSTLSLPFDQISLYAKQKMETKTTPPKSPSPTSKPKSSKRSSSSANTTNPNP